MLWKNSKTWDQNLDQVKSKVELKILNKQKVKRKLRFNSSLSDRILPNKLKEKLKSIEIPDISQKRHQTKQFVEEKII